MTTMHYWSELQTDDTSSEVSYICLAEKVRNSMDASLPSDILLQLCVRMDEDALRVVSRSALWRQVREIVSTQYFWYLRVQYEFDSALTNREGDWKDVYYGIDSYLGFREPVTRAIENNESELLIRVLLQLGYFPTVTTLKLAVGRGRDDYVRALLSDPRTVVPPAAELIPLIPKYYTSTPPTLEALLRDKRFKMNKDETEALVAQIAGPAILLRAVESGSVNLVRLLLDHGSELASYDYNNAIESKNLELVELVFSHLPSDLELNSIGIARSLAKTSEEVIRFVLARIPNGDVLERTLSMAVSENNIWLAELVLSYPSVDLGRAVWLVLNTEVTPEMFDLIMRDPRSDVTSAPLSRDVFIKLRPIIESRVMGAYNASSKQRRFDPATFQSFFYISLLKALVLQRLSPVEALDWLIDRDYSQSQTASRAVVTRTRSTSDPIVEMFYGYFISLLYHLSVQRTKEIMRSESCSRDGIELASRLIGAQNGPTVPTIATALGAPSTTDEEYENALLVLFGV